MYLQIGDHVKWMHNTLVCGVVMSLNEHAAEVRWDNKPNETMTIPRSELLVSKVADESNHHQG